MFDLAENIRKRSEILASIEPWIVEGKVSQLKGLIVEATSVHGAVGDLCRIQLGNGQTVLAEIVGFRDNRVWLIPLGETIGISPGCRVQPVNSALNVSVDDNLLGRILDGLGNPIDGLGVVGSKNRLPIHNSPPDSLRRSRIEKPFMTGIKAIDGLLTLGKGQRAGIFAGSGVGKSVLLGMMARLSDADVNVIALIGERGREVREFIENDLGPEGLARSVVVVATSDQAPTLRIKSALVATTIAEYFRDQGKDVLLMMDSITRVAMAQREIGLAVGEPPAAKGYTPSVFGLLPKILERAGNNDVGTITGLYTVLVDGDDHDEPVSDAARSILDGHIVLSRKLAQRGHYPAIDTLASISRVRKSVISPDHLKMSTEALAMMAVYQEAEDLINIGAYKQGSNPAIDQAVAKRPQVLDFLSQEIGESVGFEETVAQLKNLTTTVKNNE